MLTNRQVAILAGAVFNGLVFIGGAIATRDEKDIKVDIEVTANAALEWLEKEDKSA